MINSLNRTVVANTVKQGSVYLVNQQHFEGNSKPHFFVLLNKNPSQEQKEWYLVNSTTSIYNAKKNRKLQGWLRSTLVFADKSTCSFLNKESVFDCNNVFSTSAREFLILCDQSVDFRYRNEVSEDLLNRLVRGVRASLAISPYIKNNL